MTEGLFHEAARPRLLACGDAAVLLECASAESARAWQDALSEAPEVIDTALGATTVLLRGDPGALRQRLRATPTPPPRAIAPAADTVVIPVHYDGPDLAEVADATGLSVSEVIAAHTGQPWRVAFAGFAPGFGYLSGGDPRLTVPRRPTPRAAVPAGAVALGGGYTGIYPRPSPGGWHLIGRTDIVLWDLDRDPPALLLPGTEVRFVDRSGGVER